MEPLYTKKFITNYGKKKISVLAEDIRHLNCPIDILTTSSISESYAPTPGTIFNALYNMGIKVEELACNPLFNLVNSNNIWLSEQINKDDSIFGYIGCIIFKYKFDSKKHYILDEDKLLKSIKAYFRMLDIASFSGVKINTIAMPLIGTGVQNISNNFIVTPLINECISFLNRNEYVKEIIFIDKNPEKANVFVDTLKNSYLLFKQENKSFRRSTNKNKKIPLAFISYNNLDKNIADNLCNKLENNGIKVWYAPRNSEGEYASAIVDAIDKSDYFIVIISKNSISSKHVLNEIDIAFSRLPNDIKFRPLRIDDVELSSSFRYYLSRQHWMDAQCPPLEEKLNVFVEKIRSDVIASGFRVLNFDTSNNKPVSNEEICYYYYNFLDYEEFDSEPLSRSITRRNDDLEEGTPPFDDKLDDWEEFDSEPLSRSIIEDDGFIEGVPSFVDSPDDWEEFDSEPLARSITAINSNSKSESDSSVNSTIGCSSDSSCPEGTKGNIKCFNCGEVVSSSSIYCSNCGTKLNENIKLSEVLFSALVPKKFRSSQYIMIEVVMYEEKFKSIVDKKLASSIEDVREIISGYQQIKQDARVKIVLTSKDIKELTIENEQIWRGKFASFMFPVIVNKEYDKNEILFTASIYFNDIIATQLHFVIKKDENDRIIEGVERKDIFSAFISYASKDRKKVISIIHGMRKARPDLDIFFDVESLRSGEDWENKIKSEIEKRDALFLCWSNYAKKSEYVTMEWKYALLIKGINFIEPVPLESPSKCPPPEELKSKHFNDRILYIK